MSSRVSLSVVAQELDSLTDEERAALRASRFCSVPEAPPNRGCRLAHPGGALATNKAAALAKFLKRKLEQDGAASLDPALVERAVQNAKAAVCPGTSSITTASVRHVDSFSDSDEGGGFKRLQKNGGKVGPWTITNKNGKKNQHKLASVVNSIDFKVKTKNNKAKKRKH